MTNKRKTANLNRLLDQILKEMSYVPIGSRIFNRLEREYDMVMQEMDGLQSYMVRRYLRREKY